MYAVDVKYSNYSCMLQIGDEDKVSYGNSRLVFDPSQEDWTSYTDTMKHYFVACGRRVDFALAVCTDGV